MKDKDLQQNKTLYMDKIHPYNDFIRMRNKQQQNKLSFIYFFLLKERLFFASSA